ncbi:MAG: dihydrolipoyl dehydrogenase [Patescibacteria group bacterium]
MFDYHTIVIGAGPAGTSCAMELGKAGKRVALIEKDAVGGVCLNRGCISSKTYLYLVEILENIKKAKRFGIEVGEPKVIWEEVKKRKDLNVKMLGLGLKKTLGSHNVEIIQGKGTLTGTREVTVESAKGEKKITADNIVVAVGTSSLFLPIMPKGEHVISSTEILDLAEIPKSLAIIGGGVTGVEMATVFSGLGSEVVMIEKMTALLPGIDREIAAILKKSLEKKGCQIYLGAEVLSCQDGEGGADIVYQINEEKKQMHTTKALVVIGRAVNYDLNEFERLGIKHDGRRVILNDNLQTSISHIYFIGDGAFRNLTAYGAEYEGEAVAQIILGKQRSIHYEHIPVTIFSHPEVGQIGITEEHAQERWIDYEVRRSSYASNAKAIIMGEREGMVKMIIDKATQKVLGVHVIGVHATDLIHQAFLPVVQGMTIEEWLGLVWSHPALSEVIKNALENDQQSI